jgi:hypothetical protein
MVLHIKKLTIYLYSIQITFSRNWTLFFYFRTFYKLFGRLNHFDQTFEKIMGSEPCKYQNTDEEIQVKKGSFLLDFKIQYTVLHVHTAIQLTSYIF